MIRDYCPVPMRARTRVHVERCGFALERRRCARIPDRDRNGETTAGDPLVFDRAKPGRRLATVSVKPALSR